MNISNKIFFIILIYEFNFIYCLHASTTNKIKPVTKQRPIGICRANQTTLTPVQVWETINEPQLQNYPCTDGSDKICAKHIMVTRNVTKTVSVKGFKQVYVCCKGYKKMGKKCEPKCYPECEHGQCIKPNTCKCDAGYKLLTNSKCTPDCKNCKNGYCLTPTECKCYSLFEKSANGTCVPRCDPMCVNGDCLAPNVCTCHGGYEADAFYKHTCNPVCNSPCGDGGRCIAPDVCECSPGYQLNSTKQCEPVCENCDNGVCTKPGECACNEKYESKMKIGGNDENDKRCEPICQVPCGDRGPCIAPDVCQCNSGYRLNKTHAGSRCEPVCENCDNGTCIKPGECTCNENYENRGKFTGDTNETRCEPICKTPCRDRGRCIAPDVCECNPGFRLNETQQCEPVCENCDNGVCTKPGECLCNEKYESKTKIVGSDNQKRCEPICEVPCGDGGRCIEPDVCECNSGYRLNSTKQCEPICERCNNGVCIKPGQCECNENYQYIEERCEPVCTEPCVNGFCSEPNECTCDKGYERDMHLKHICNRMCDPPCINGRCTPENECECLPGFLPHSFKNHECLNCTYTCTESEDCPIPEGCPCPGSEEFNMETYGCERPPATSAPECSGTCVNSNCTYGQCICYDGYNKKQDDSNICFALCNNNFSGCINGNCNQPDVCDCYDGYTLSPYTKFECILIEKPVSTTITTSTTTTTMPTTTTTMPTTPTTTTTTVTVPTTITTSSPPSFPSSTTSATLPSSTNEFVELRDEIQPLNRMPADVECIEGDCHSSEMEQIRKGGMPQLLKAHYNYVLIVIGVAALFVIIVLTMIYRKYNRTKTFKTHEQEAFLSSPYFIGGPIKTSCDIELDEN